LGLPSPLFIAITKAQTYEKENIWRIRIKENRIREFRTIIYIVLLKKSNLSNNNE
jgi:hypothetical protein